MKLRIVLYAILLFFIVTDVLFAQDSHRSQANVIKLIKPLGGEKWQAGTINVIQWSGNGLQGTVNISLWDASGGIWSPIATNIPAVAESYTWNVPAYLRGERFRLRIESTTQRNVVAYSATFFSVEPAAEIVAGMEPGLRDGAAVPFVRLKPNPAAESTTLFWYTVEPIERILVRDMMGRTVKTLHPESNAAHISINTSALSSGMYIVELHSRARTKHVKLIVRS